MLLETLLMSMPPVAHEMEFMPMNKQEEVFKALIGVSWRGDLKAINSIFTADFSRSITNQILANPFCRN